MIMKILLLLFSTLIMLNCKIANDPKLKSLVNFDSNSQTFTVGGSISGLGSNSITISLNSIEQLVLSTNRNFIFTTTLASSISYNVAIQSMPSDKYCTIQNGSGTIQTNVSNVTIVCQSGTSVGPLVGGSIFNPIPFTTPAGVTVTTVPSGVPLTGVNGISTDGVNIYLAVYDNHTIAKLVISTGVFTTIAGTVGVSGSSDGFGTAATFRNPGGLVYLNNMLYITDTLNGKIRAMDLATGNITTMASGLANPYGITTDGTFLYFNQDFKVNSLKIADNSLAIIVGNANGYVDGGIGVGKLGSASGAIAYDGTYLYLNDRSNCSIRKIDIIPRTITTIVGSLPPTVSCGTLDGIGTTALVQSTDGIVSDGTNLFFAESDTSSRIRKITLSTMDVTTLVGIAGIGDLDGGGTIAKINAPAHITSDGTNLYFADYVNSKVKKIH